jgi:inosine-uridine nucleoside N-ribohydrolase
MTKDLVIITDLGSVDPDDVFSLVMLSSFDNINIKGIIASHFYSHRRAQLASLLLQEFGKKNIPVYAGIGINEKDDYTEGDRVAFFKANELFPPLFGFPKHICKDGEKEWFPNFMKGYTEHYHLNDYKFEEKSGILFLTEELKKYSPDNKLIVVCLSPMHDLAMIPACLFENMSLFVMGGGFEEEIKGDEKEIKMERIGYNWGITPDATEDVLQRLSIFGNKMTLISSELVRRKGINIPLNIYNKWLYLTQNTKVPLITKAIMSDWNYCNKGNKLSQHKNLCDPLTLYLAITGVFTTVDLKATVNKYDKNITSYLDTRNLVTLERSNLPNVSLVVDFPSDVKYQIINRLENLLFPLDYVGYAAKVLSDEKGIYKVSRNADIKQLKEKIFAEQKFSGKIVQIVGDCVAYSPETTLYCMKFLEDNIGKDEIIEWGLTGIRKGYELSYDINHMVSQIIDNNGLCSIGNAVDYHTPYFLTKFKSTYSRTNNCVITVVDGGKAKFGADVDISDGLCDRLVAVEGGIQSFLQMINCLSQGKRVTGLCGVRRVKNYFSACEFMWVLKNDKNIGTADEKYVTDKLNEYLKEKLLYDKDKADACTKQALFDAAWKKFVEEKIWTKLDLINVVQK